MYARTLYIAWLRIRLRAKGNQSSKPISASHFALRNAARSSSGNAYHPSTDSSSSISHFSSSSSCFLVFLGGGGRGGGGGGVRLFGCNGAMRRSIDFEDFSKGVCVRRVDENGDPGIELTLRSSSDIGTFLGMMDEARHEFATEDERCTTELFGVGV
jgi:hypothetical protein